MPQDLVIFAQPTGEVQPADGPLDDPAPLEQDEARAAGRARHDLEHPLGGAACAADQSNAVGAVGPDPPQARHPPTTLLQQQATTARSCTPAEWTSSPCIRPRVSTSRWRLRPLISLPRSTRSSPPRSTVLTDWLPRMAADGCGSRPAARRTSARKWSCSCCQVPSSRQRRKSDQAVPQGTRSRGTIRH
jgi:hypothetical protein